MRKLLLTTAAVAAAIGLAGCGNGDPDTLIDKRDGQKYRTVVIGGTRWMAQNLNYQTDSSWCYENSTDSCNKYGRLYNWMTATTVCPKGWKLPSREDWDQLAESVGGRKSDNYDSWHDWLDAGKKLKSTSGWYNNSNGTDDVGFSALPGGYRFSAGGFLGAGNNGHWWTATECGGSIAYYRFMRYGDDDVIESLDYKSFGYSVRCVADRP